MLAVIVASACSQASPSETPTPTRRGALTPYRSPSPTRTLTPWPSPLRATSPPLPTPTPFLHVIGADDTLLSIAYRYGVSLDALMAANPGVDPYLLSPGKTLVIPIGEDALLLAPTPTLMPLKTEVPRCYPVADGGLWCLCLVSNDQTFGVENLSARLELYTLQGDLLVAQQVAPLLNLLLPGQALPLAAYFAPPLPPTVVPQAQLLSAIAALPDEQRYLTTTLLIEQSDIAPSGWSATLQGVVSVAQDGPPARLFWVVAVAYDAAGYAVGVRKWEKSAAANEQGWQSLPFAVTVFSLGAPIERVELLAEARP